MLIDAVRPVEGRANVPIFTLDFRTMLLWSSPDVLPNCTNIIRFLNLILLRNHFFKEPQNVVGDRYRPAGDDLARFY